MFPIAWEIVEVENYDSWIWFIKLLMNDLDSIDGQGCTVISDQHKGLVEALHNFISFQQHIHANFRKQFNGVELRNLFWQITKLSTEATFNVGMYEMRSQNGVAYNYLMQREPETWSRAFFRTETQCDNVENNLSESFNARIVKARGKPIITMLEEIRVSLMERMDNMRKLLAKCNDHICPNVRKRMWQLSGYPCVHGCAAIMDCHERPDTFVSHWLRTENFGKSYGYYLKPVNGVNMWPKVVGDIVLSPKRRRLPGRPKKARKRGQEEGRSQSNVISKKGMMITCSNCKTVGPMQNESAEPVVNLSEPCQESQIRIPEGLVGVDLSIEGVNLIDNVLQNPERNHVLVDQIGTSKSKLLVRRSTKIIDSQTVDEEGVPLIREKPQIENYSMPHVVEDRSQTKSSFFGLTPKPFDFQGKKCVMISQLQNKKNELEKQMELKKEEIAKMKEECAKRKIINEELKKKKLLEMQKKREEEKAKKQEAKIQKEKEAMEIKA